MPKAKDESESTRAADEDDAYHLTVRYVTDLHGPPHHVITVRDDYHDWADVAMSCVESDGWIIWSADVTTPKEQGPVDIAFKLVLDGRYWMSGANQGGTTARPAAILEYDDTTVEWEPEGF